MSERSEVTGANRWRLHFLDQLIEPVHQAILAKDYLSASIYASAAVRGMRKLLNDIGSGKLQPDPAFVAALEVRAADLEEMRRRVAAGIARRSRKPHST